MTQYNISSTTTSDMTSNVSNVTIDSKTTEGSNGQDEIVFNYSNFAKYYGAYRTIPELKIAVDMRAVWTGGNGFEADAEAKVILDHIKGNGYDNFNSIIRNMRVIRRVCGGAFAEIIRANDADKTLLNLKPLSPNNMRIIYDKKGRIKRFEQVNGSEIIKFNPDEIFYLQNKRVADEMGGISDVEALYTIIEANKESFEDIRKLMHRYVKPMMKFILDTDDDAKINALVAKFDSAVNKGENLYIPKGSVEQELIAVPANSTLNPLPWREHLKNYFFQVVGIPQIILGSSGEFTESTAKIAYLAFEQSVEEEQNEDEQQVWNQLGLRVKWSFPASLRNELLTDESKDGSDKQMQAEINPAGVEE